MSAYDNWLTAPLRDQERAEAHHEWLCEKADDAECQGCGETGCAIEDGEVLDYCETCHKACHMCGEVDVAKKKRGHCAECCVYRREMGKKERRTEAAYPGRKAKRDWKRRFGKPAPATIKGAKP